MRDYILNILNLATEVEKSSGDLLKYHELENKFELFLFAHGGKIEIGKNC